jgi:periplasmic protein TonB
MFTVVVDRRKRSVWSPRTIAVSIGAHVLVLAGIIAAATNTQAAPAPVVVDIWTAPVKPTPAPPKPTPPASPDQPVPVKGTTLVLRTPDTVPDHVTAPHPDDIPINPSDVRGLGPEGDVLGPPDSTTTPRPPTGDTRPLRDFRTDVFGAEEADVLPQLLSPREAQRMLERAYPSILRDAGVTGHTTVELVIDRTGAVQPGSIAVQETTHDAFRDAAIRAAARFRFRPATIQGVPISVKITIPIDWQIQP